MTGSKEWVTVKVPKAVRDAARDDPRTYGEVMRDGIAVQEALKGVAANEVDTLLAAGRACLTGEGIEDYAPKGDGGSGEPPEDFGLVERKTDARDDARETLERIESAVETIEERTGAIDRTLEDLNR